MNPFIIVVAKAAVSEHSKNFNSLSSNPDSLESLFASIYAQIIADDYSWIFLYR